MLNFNLRKSVLAAMCAGIALGAAPAIVLADNASDIQALKDQVRAMQQKIDQLSGPAKAAAPSPASPGAAAPAKSKDAPTLTFAGVTLYGTIDAGIAYMTHGAPLSQTWSPGLPYFIQSFSNHSILSAGPNGL